MSLLPEKKQTDVHSNCDVSRTYIDVGLGTVVKQILLKWYT